MKIFGILKSHKLISALIIGGIVLAISAVVLLIMLPKDGTAYKITFESNGGSSVDNIVIEENNLIKKPQDPIKEDYKFIGWYYNGKPYDFSQPVTDNTKLEAVWEKIEKVSGVKLENSKLTLTTGKTAKLIATVLPENADNKNITWKSSNPSVVSVDQSGNIKALKAGKATIKVTTEDGGYIAKVEIVVNATIKQESNTQTTNSYRVTFVDENGKTLSTTQRVESGNKAVEPKKPVKEGHTFIGWYNGNTKYEFTEKVKANIKLTAKWTKNKYTVTFKNYDGTVLETKELEYGTIPTYTGVTPIKAADQKCTYTFAGWSSSIKAVKGNATYTAVFEEEYIDYVITFVDEDGTEVNKLIYHFGEKVSQPIIPTKESDGKYTYTFAGWSPCLTEVTGNATYTATYTAKLITCNVIFVDEDGTTLVETQITDIGSIATEPEKPSKEGHTFIGWYNGETEYTFKEEVKSNITLTAKWTKNKYTVTFENENGDVLETKQVEYGTKPEYTGKLPVKASDEQYTYTFNTWSPSITEVKGDVTYTATYTETLNKYTITFVNENGDVLETKQVEYGTKPEYTGKTPVKASDEKYTYTFNTWSPSITEVKSEEKYTAIYTETLNKYTVTFVDEDGKELATAQTIEYGSIATEPEKPSKEGHTFIGWYNGETEYTFKEEVKSNITLTAKWTKNKYTVTFENENGDVLETKQVEYGTKPEYTGKLPVKASDEKYTYTFKTWSPSITEVKGDVTYTATYTETLNKYTITFVNENGDVLETKQVEYGTKPEYTGNTPVKASDEKYTYTFNTWSPSITEVKGDVTYTATYTESLNKYTVTFENENGDILETKQVEYGKIPEYTGKTPIKVADEKYTYTFVGWNQSITEVKGDVTYTAIYSATINKYNVTFVDENGKELETAQTIEYGSVATEPEKPSKEGHTFVGWYNVETKYTFTEQVKSNITLTAKWTKNKYTVTFVNYDGTVLETRKVEYGTTPEYTEKTPEKASNEQYTYIFKTWSPSITEVKGDVTYTATYTETLNKYTITFVDEDGKELATTQTIEYGSIATKPEKPSKEGHTFVGWYNGEKEYTFKEEVKSNITLTAKWTKNKYTVTFVNENGDILETKQVEYGAKPEYTGKTPVKAADEKYTYTFKTWSPSITEVKGDVTYTAMYTETLNKYTITFVDENGDILETKQVEYGTTPEYTGKTPVKASNEKYTYTFNTWSPSITEVKGDVTYTVTYTESLNKYTVTFKNENGDILETKQVEYGKIPEYTGKTPIKVADEKYTYTFVGWNQSITEVKGDVTYTAIYTSTLNKYTVTFVDKDGKELATAQTIEYGSVATKPEKPSKEGHTFVGWYNEKTEYTFKEEVKSNITLTAKWTKNKYTVTFVNENGDILETKQVEYGAKPEYTGKTPVKAADEKYTYTFKTWSPSITEVKGDVTYTATYISTSNKYTVTFKNYDGTVLETKQVEYGTIPEYTGKPPVKVANEKYTYTFKTWSPSITEVKGDVTYTATYTESLNKYTITFVDENGDVLETKQVEYGTKPEYTGKTPVKASNKQYTYTFKTWSPSITEVKGDVTYTAIYSATLNKYTVTFVDKDGKELATAQTIEYGSVATEPEKPSKEGHTFMGWYNGETEYTFKEEVKSNITLTAKWERKLYNITFKNYDGTVLETKHVEYGFIPIYKGRTPVKPMENYKRHVFVGWSPSITGVKGDTTYTAMFKYLMDIDDELSYAVARVYSTRFSAKKQGDDINIKFTGFTTVNSEGVTTQITPPYAFLQIFYEVIDLLSSISTHESYESFELYYRDPSDYKGQTIDLTDYDLTDTSLGNWYNGGANDRIGEWIGYVATGTASTGAAFKANSDNLVGKTITLKITLKDDYALENGKQSAVYSINFDSE